MLNPISNATQQKLLAAVGVAHSFKRHAKEVAGSQLHLLTECFPQVASYSPSTGYGQTRGLPDGRWVTGTKDMGASAAYTTWFGRSFQKIYEVLETCKTDKEVEAALTDFAYELAAKRFDPAFQDSCFPKAPQSGLL